jgi:hypothetical protein
MKRGGSHLLKPGAGADFATTPPRRCPFKVNDLEVSEEEDLATLRANCPRRRQSESPLLENREKWGTRFTKNLEEGRLELG